MASATTSTISVEFFTKEINQLGQRCRHTGWARRLLIFLVMTVAVLLAGNSPAQAHQPVRLTSANPTADRGPLLVDGTVSFAVYATVKGKQTRGFRFGLRTGQRLQAGDGRCFFAGDWTTYASAWMSGAVESAWIAAKRISATP